MFDESLSYLDVKQRLTGVWMTFTVTTGDVETPAPL